MWTALEGNGAWAHTAPDATITTAQTARRNHLLKHEMLKNEPPKSRPPDFLTLWHARVVAAPLPYADHSNGEHMLTIPPFASSFGA
jgi:hypothetical protein